MIMSNISNSHHTDSGGASKSSYYNILWASQPIEPFSIRFSLENLSVLTHSDKVHTPLSDQAGVFPYERSVSPTLVRGATLVNGSEGLPGVSSIPMTLLPTLPDRSSHMTSAVLIDIIITGIGTGSAPIFTL